MEQANKYFGKMWHFEFFSAKEFPDYLAITSIWIVFSYALVRAYSLSLTHDEAITYLNHARGSFRDILTYAGPIMSNSHLLNTIMIKIFTEMFGISELVIRAPALIGLGLYLIGIYRILRLVLKRYSLLLGVCLLAWHPLMLDLFSCARGYSLGLGFMTLGLFYFFRIINKTEVGYERKNYILSSAMFVLSSLSHLSFVNVFVSMIGVYVLFEVMSLVKKHIPINLPSIQDAGKDVILAIVPSSMFLLMVYAYPVFKMMRAGNEFIYGGENGFWQDTVGSLIEVTLYKPLLNSNVMLFSKVLIVALLLFALIGSLRDEARDKEVSIVSRYLNCVMVLLLICSLSIIVQHFLLKIKYPLDRYAIYLIPIFFLVVLFRWKSIRCVRNNLIRNVSNGVFYVIIIGLLGTFVARVNITHFSQWRYDASTKNMVEDIMKMNKNRSLEDGSVQLGVNWIFEPSTNYYILKNRIRWMRKVDKNGPEGMFDYYYVTPDYEELLEKRKLKLIKRYGISGNYLAVSDQFGDESFGGS